VTPGSSGAPADGRFEWVRKATGSAVVQADEEGRVLLLRRAYPPYDWVLPGGGAEAGESPTATAVREVREETGLDVELERLTGVYYHADHAAGEFIHFVFRGRLPGGADIRPQATEVAEWAFFAPDSLPEPMSPSTRLRLLDALAGPLPALPVTLPPQAE
jgi:ADP-ribose pyrophosphatase YjhB (NUDIX family)